MAYRDSYNVEYSDDGKTLIKAPKELEGEYYANSGVSTIGNAAFHGCEKLRVLHLPSSLKLVDYAAFGQCKLLRAVYFGSDISDWLNITWRSSFSTSYLLYFQGKLVTEAIIPAHITKIKPDAFYYCGSIKSVHFHQGVTEIGESAFNKSNLSGQVILPEGMQKVMSMAFFCCTELNIIQIPSTLSEFGYGALGCCDNLRNIIVSSSNQTFKSALGIMYDSGGKLRAIAPCATDAPIKLPSCIHKIAKHTFCYTAVPKGGLVLSRDITKLEEDAFFKVENLKVLIPFGSATYFKDLGIPMDNFQELFSIDSAFLPGHKCISAVANNPFRTLGVFANASQKEITANARKIKRFIEVGKPAEFPSDLNNILPPVNRTAETVDAALALISNPLEKYKAALFWFASVDDIDNIGLQNLQNGNIAKAKEIFEKKKSWHSSLNVSSMAFAQNQLETAVASIMDSIHNYTYPTDIASAVCGEEFQIYEYDAAHMVIDALLEDIPLPQCRVLIKEHGQADDDDEYLNELLFAKYTKLINDAIAAAKSASKTNPQASLDAGRRLKETTEEPLKEFALYAGENDTEYGLTADRLANQILQCAIDYYNDSIDRFAVFDALELTEYALSIVKGQVKKDRCQQNLDILKKIAAKLPPRAVEAQDEALSELLERSVKQYPSISNIWVLLEEAAPHIVYIQECIDNTADGTTEREYLENYRQHISTAVISLALSKLIKVVNDSAQHDFKTIIEAWDIMLNMDNFPMDVEFYEKRYSGNRDKLEEIRAEVAGIFGKKVAPDEPSRTIDMRTSQEVWDDCEDIEDYEDYIERYPNGSHVREAENRIEALRKEEEDRVWNKAKKVGDYKEYISKYPNGRYSSEAIVAQREVENKRDDDTFYACKTIAQFSDYLKNYPVGRHHEEAEAKLEELKAEDDKVWNACKTKKDCMNYLAEHATGQHIQDAKALIEKLEKRSKVWIAVIAIEVIVIAILLAYIFCSPSDFQGATVGIIVGALIIWAIAAVIRSNK